jgi:RNA polymerase sigma factor (sigma-70 family)
LSGSDPELHAKLHRDLCNGDPTAPEALVREFLTPLVRILRRRHLVLPREMLVDAASDAIIALIQRPERFQPQRSSLLTFLVTIADRRLIDYLRAMNRRASREVYIGGAQNLGESLVSGEAHASYSVSDVTDALPPEIQKLVADVLPDQRDRDLLDLICEGRNSIDEYASLLGLNGLPIQEQRAAIKRNRDRVLNRLRRRREEFRRIRGHGNDG